MMDDSKQYQAMCEKAWPYLEKHLPNISKNRQSRMLYAVEGALLEWRDLDLVDGDRAFPLWEQDQLQAIVGFTDCENTYALLKAFERWVTDACLEDICITGWSFEQLWLAFVMT